MLSSIRNIASKRYEKGRLEERDDLVVVEEPLEIRLGYGPLDAREEHSLVITMRTPGNDFELAAGFLYCEGIITDKSDILSIKYCYNSHEDQEEDNVVRVELREGYEPDLDKSERHSYATSACGICGLTSIDSAFKLASGKKVAEIAGLKESAILDLSEKVHAAQINFRATGGIHAAALFTVEGELLDLKEDVGRHNALDKLIGAHVLSEKKMQGMVFLSGRMGFELVQKAAMAEIPVLISVGAPSSLAIDLGKKMHMTLIGFSKKDKFNIYSGFERIEA